jgi:hypothetical protein
LKSLQKTVNSLFITCAKGAELKFLSTQIFAYPQIFSLDKCESHIFKCGYILAQLYPNRDVEVARFRAMHSCMSNHELLQEQIPRNIFQLWQHDGESKVCSTRMTTQYVVNDLLIVTKFRTYPLKRNIVAFSGAMHFCMAPAVIRPHFKTDLAPISTHLGGAGGGLSMVGVQKGDPNSTQGGHSGYAANV